MIRSAAERLVAAYENDLETDIYDEFVQFRKLLKTDLGKPVVEQHQSAESVELRMYRLIINANPCKHLSRITNLFVTNSDKPFLLEAKTHQERATFNNASRTIESPNVDEPRTRGVAESWSISLPRSNLDKNSDLQLTLYPEYRLKLAVVLDVPLRLGLNCDM